MAKISQRGPAKREGGATREKIVRAAAQLVYSRGFNATSLAMVARAAGVNRGSLYYFFRTKKILALAVIAHFEALLRGHFLDPAFGGEGSGREKLDRFAELYARMPSTEPPCCGCPLGNLSLELGSRDEELRARLARVWGEVLGRVEGALRQAQQEGALPPGADAGGLARAFFEQIQGAHILARSTLDAEALLADCRRAIENLPWRDDELPFSDAGVTFGRASDVK
jgi:AcrR family transcriptional regulator